MDVKEELKLLCTCTGLAGDGGRGVGGWSTCKKIGGGGEGARSGRRWGVEGWGLVDREGVGWQQCWG